MTLEATSKENDYRNYFQSWHMGTTNKLLQTTLRKRTHTSRKPEEVIITYHHTVGEDGLGFYQTAIITKSFRSASISNDLDGMEDNVLWDEQHDKSDTDSI